MKKKLKVLSNDGPLSNKAQAAAGGDPGPTADKQKRKVKGKKRGRVTFDQMRKKVFGIKKYGKN
ncbi:MAG: hypothetical protein V4436_02000 [Patescibacteria group bacterium]